MEAVTPKERCGVTCLEYIDGLEYSHLTKRMSNSFEPKAGTSIPCFFSSRLGGAWDTRLLLHFGQNFGTYFY